MPYANFDGSFDDMTIDYDSVQNMLLALDRGEPVQPSQYGDLEYKIKRLTLRTEKPDFKYLPPNVQQSYQQTINQFSQLEAQKQVQIQRAQQGYIPTGGQLLGCDFFVSDPANPTRTRRARLPSESVQWLVTQLEAQGQGLEQLENLNSGSQAQIASLMSQQPGGIPQPRPGVPHTSAMLPKGMGLAGSPPPPASSPPRRFMPQMPANGMAAFRGP